MAFEDLLSGRLSGAPLAAVALALRRPAVARVGLMVLRRDLGIDRLRGLLDGQEVLEPDIAPRAGREPRALTEPAGSPERTPWVTSAAAFTEAYARGASPEAVLTRLYAEADRLAQQRPWLGCVWSRDEPQARREAQAAHDRYKRGEPLGPLDGVPVLVKEQIAVRGLPRRLGGELPGPASMGRDATLVARLRAAGAVIAGQTAMTELGMSPIGINPKRPPLRNPHHADRTAGGSSTGAGIAVSLGLCPVAVGADGGGSIRIPAAMCGVFGLKPTYGRVSRAGDGFSGSLGHDGPLGASARDLALFLDATHGPDAADPASLHARAPREPFAQAIERSVRGMRLGVDEHELRDADGPVARACEQAMRTLEKRGVELVDVKLKLARHALAMGCVTIVAETYATTLRDFTEHGDGFGLDLQAFMRIASVLEAKEYLIAQALRERLRREMSEVFADVDALALPTTASTALPVSETDERTGRLDAQGVRAMCRFGFLGNLTGLPAGTAPVGTDPAGLPIGLQIVGDAWDDATVLAFLAELERSGASRVPRPPHHIALLE